MKRGTKVAVGVAGALLGGLVLGAKASAKPKTASVPALPPTLPGGQAPVQGIAANWYQFTTLAADGNRFGALFYSDATSALLLLDGATAAMTTEQMAQFEAFVLVDGTWKRFER